MQFFTRIKALLFFFSLFAAFLSQAQTGVTITQGTVSNLCIGSSPATLSNIVIQEITPGHFLEDDAIGGGNSDITGTLILGIDADFQFVAGTGSVSVTGGDIFLLSYSVTTTAVTLNIFAQNATAPGDFVDNITISGLQVRAINTPAQTGSITRTGGTLPILGLVNGDQVGSATSVANPTPSISGLATVCENQTGVSYTTASVVGHTYAWSVTGGSITAGAGTNTITVTWGSSGPGSVQVTQTSSVGCVTTTSPYPVTFNPLPTPSISGDNSVCATEQNVVYTTASVVGHTYSWLVTGGTIDGSSTNNSVTVDWGVAGPGTVRVTETITATGCLVQTPLYNVTINTNPSPSIGGLATVCANQTGVSYTSASVVGDTYAWSVTGGSITAGAGSNTITVTWGSSGAGSVQVIQTTTATGCATTTAAYPVLINANPTPGISGDNSVCATEQNVVYTTASVVGHTYSWLVTGGTIDGSSTNNSVTVDWGVAGPGTVRVTETITATGCLVQTPLYNVTINTNPSPSIGGLATVCANQTGVSYTSASVVGDTYAWSVTGGSITAGAGSNTITVTWGSSGAGSVQVIQTTTATGCATTTAAYPVLINANPTPGISGDNSVCATEQNVVYTTASVVGHTYSWLVTGGTIDGSSTNNSVTVDWGVAGPGTVRVTETITATGCLVQTPLYNVTINTNPSPSIGGLATVCANQTGVSYTSASVVGDTYAWSVTGGSITAGAGSNTITVTWGSSGAGSVQVTQTTTATGCATTTAAYPVLINANPTPGISGDNSVCATEQNVVYTTASVVGHTYSWLVTGGTIDGSSTNNSVTVDWGVAGPGTVRVTETITATGCLVQTPLYNVTINTNPSPSIGGLATVCANQTGVSYTSASVVGDTYAWSVTGGSITAGAGSNTITVTWGSSGVGSVQVIQTTTATGCATTTAAYPVLINANPTPGISGDNSVCATEQNVVYTTASVVGHTYSWLVTGGTIDGSSTNNSVTVDWGVAGPGTVRVTETITATGCLVQTPLYNVTINTNPSPSIGGLATVCANQTGVSYTSASVVGDTYAWSVTGGSITAGAGSNTITVTWGSSGAGSVQVIQTTTATGCATTTAAYPVLINANPTPGISGDNSVCATEQNVVYTTASVVGHTYSWLVTGGTIDGSSTNNSVTVDWGVAGPGTVRVTETITATGCLVQTPLYNVTINTNPSPSIGGLATVCANQTGVSYTSASVVGDTYAWSVTGGSITAGAGSNTITVTWGSSGAGSVQVTQTTTATGCATTTAAYPVLINANPTPGISGDNSVCATEQNVVYTTASVVGHTYSWLVTGGTIDGSSTNNSVTVDWGVAGPGTVRVTETITATGCLVQTPLYNVTINTNPSPSIGGLATVCANQTGVSYTSASVVGDTYAWSVTGGSITAGAGSNTITVTWGSSGAGSVQVTQTTTATGCATTTAAYPVLINANPTPSISGNNSVCATEQDVAYSISLIAGRTYSWLVTGGTIDGSSTGNSILVDWGAAGPGTLQVTETITATGCFVTTPLYNIIINNTPTPSISGLATVCANTTGVIYSTPNVIGDIYSWTVVGGSITAGSGTNSISVDWGGAGAGSVTLTQFIIGSGCTVTTNPYLVTINAIPTPSITGDNTVCANVQDKVYSTPLVGGHTYSWTVSGGTIDGSSTSNSILVDWGAAGLGTIQLTETITASGCVIVTPIFSVNINNIPTPVISGLNAVCANDAGVVYSTPNVPGNSYSWSVTGGTVASGAGTSSITVNWGPAGSGSITLTELVPSSSCVTVTAPYSIIINSTPSPVVTGDNSVCETDQDKVYTSSFTPGNTYSWSVSGGTIDGSSTSNNVTVDWGVTGAGTLSLTETVGGCSTTTPVFNVTINPNPTPVIAGSNSVCRSQSGVTYSTPPAAGRAYSWTVVGGTIDSGAGTNSISVTWTAAGTGSVSVTETISASACNITTAPFLVSVAPNPVVNAGSDEEICSGLPFNFMAQVTPATATDFASLLWTTTGTGVLSNPATLTPSYTPGVGETGPVTFTLTGEGIGACPDAVDQMILNITPLPVVSAGSDSETCAGILFNFSTQLTPASASNYSLITWSHSGTGTLFNPNTLAPTYLPGVGETGIVNFTIQANSTGSCAFVTDVMQLDITPAPTVNAGGDAEICQGLAYNFATQSPSASATNFLSILWTTSGTGSIASANTLAPIYTPGVGEVGNVTFTLTVNGNGSCGSIQDVMTLSITPSPATSAGSDEEICEGSTFSFSTQATLATASNYNTITWTTSGAGTLFNANTLTPTYFPLVGETGNIIFTLTAIGNGSCVSVNDQMTLAITPSPTVTAGSDAETCQGITYNFITQVTPSNATNYASILWSTTGTGVLTNPNTLTPSYAPGVGETGNVIFILTAIGNGSCLSVNDQMTLVITPSPTVTAGSDAETCQGISYNFSTQGTPSNATNYASILWTTLGTGTLTNANTFVPSYAPGVGETGNIIFTLTAIGNGSCISVNDQMTLAITPSPTVTAGSDAETCQGITYNFITQVTPSNATNYASILWSTTGTGVLTNPNTLTPSYAPGVGETGNVIFTLTAIGNGSCLSVNDQMTLVITPSPTITAGSDAETCQAVSYNFSTQGTPASGTNYASVLWTHSGTGTIFNANTLTPTYAPGVGETGNVTFTLTALGNGSCTSVNDQMNLVITPSPTIAAGSDAETCQGVTYNFSTQSTLASGTNYASLLWTHSGTGTIFNANTLSPTYAPGVGETGIVTFTLTAMGNGSCASVNDQMTLVITPSPTVTAGSDSETCQGISFNFSSQGTPANASNYASILWTHSGTGTIFNDNTLTPTYLPGIGEAGNVTFTLTATGNGSCLSVNDQVNLAITPSPTVTAGSDAETCQGISYNFSTQTTLAIATNNSGVLWTTTGTGILTNANTLTPSYAPGVGETGNVIFTLTATGNGSCASVNDQMILTITPSPTVSAGSDSETCQGINFNFSGQSTLASSSNFSSILWTTAGTGLLSNANTLTPTYSPGIGETGIVTFTLTASGNGSCASVNDQMTLMITPSPTVTAGSDAETCQGVSFNFSTRSTLASATNNSSLIWITTGTGILTNANTLSPSYAPGAGETGNVTFTLTAMGNGSCISVNDQMTLVITPSPTVTAGSDAETCQGINYNFGTQSTPSNATNYFTILWTTTGTGTIFNATTFAPTYQPGIGEAGNVTFTLTATGNGSCVSVNDQMTLVITPSPIVSAGSNAETCQGISYNFGTQSTLASATNFSGLLWTHTGTGSLTGSTSLTPTYTPGVGETGTVTFTLTANGNGSCVALNDVMVLTITPSVTISAGSDEEICQGGVFNFVTQSTLASALNYSSLIWTHSGAGTLYNSNTLTPTYFAFAGETGTVTFTLTALGNGSCVSLNDPMILTITPAPIAIAGSDDAVCEGTPTFDFATRSTIASSLNGSILWTHNGTGSLNDPTIINPTYTVGAGDVNNTITFTLSITSPSAVCSVVQDQFALRVNRAALVTVPSTSVTVCEPQRINLLGSFGGSATSGAWSLITGGGTLSTSSITGLNVTAVYDTIFADVGSLLQFRLTTNDPDGTGPCASVFVDMDVTIEESAKVFAGNDFEVCEYDDIDLNGSFSGATSSIMWSGGSGAPQFGNVTSPITSYDMTPAEQAATNLVFTFTLTSDDPSTVCPSVFDQVNVIVNDTLNTVQFTTVLGSVYAENDPLVDLQFAALPLGGTYTGPGVSGLSFFPSIANITPQPPNIITYTYVDGNGCISAPRKVVIVNPLTNVNFSIQYAIPDPLGLADAGYICANQGDLILQEEPNLIIPSLPPPKSTLFESPDLPPGSIYFDGSGPPANQKWKLKTDGLAANVYFITYTYTNEFSVANPVTRQIRVTVSPKAIIDAGNTCETSDVLFTESSTVPPPIQNPYGATPTDWFWEFNDGTGTTNTSQEPTYRFPGDGVYNVRLQVTTNEGCTRDTIKAITIGPVPEMNFSWSEFCNGNDTKFVDGTNPGISTIVLYTWEFNDGFTVSGPAGGPIPGGTNGGRTSGTYTNPNHRYDLFGQKDVKLTVVTDVGCEKDTTQTVSIVSYSIPSPIVSYYEDFEATQGSWFPTFANQFGVTPLPTDTSWVWGAPNGTEINTGSSSANAWWTGNNPNFVLTNSTYYNNENSAVLGPCVNLMNVKRPMMSIDYWSDSEDNFDGAAIQYSIDGGASWQTLGDDGGAGINWYNGRALTGNPGEQIIGQFGWSDRQGGWKNARYNLDQIPMSERNEVIFRVAFGSNDDNDVTAQMFNGFAFDNVFIGEKQRNVLVEYFTNDGINQTVNDYLNNLYSDKSNVFLTDSADFVKIQYHIANPAADVINQDNPVDPATRSIYYGVSLPPVGIMDGILGDYFGTTFNGDQNKINLVEIDRRTLEDPLFDIQITELPSVTNDSINLSVDFVYTDSIQTLSTPVTFQIGLVQDSVLVGTKLMENVLRKFLLGSEGQTVNTVWTPGILPTTLLVKSAIDVPIGVNNQNLWIVAFVQDRNTKRMHQMVLKEISAKTEATIVGVEDPVLTGAQKIDIFPNPASRQLNFTSEYRLMEGYTYSIVDQRGITLQRGELKEDIFTPQQVELDNLANGVYFVIISRGGRALVHRKIVVLNRN